MKELINVLVFLLPLVSIGQSNVGIGTNSPASSAQLDISATDKGVLVPRVALTNVFLATPVSSPSEGLLIWNTNDAVTNGAGKGFYFWNGSRWQKLVNGSEAWNLTGNATIDTGLNFVGTTQNFPLLFRVNNTKAGAISVTGANTFLGIRAGQFNKFSSQNFTGDNNTFFGSDAGKNNINGRSNTFIGSLSGQLSDNAFGNTAIGSTAGSGMTSGQFNTLVGLSAGGGITTGSQNVVMGGSTGSSMQDASGNVYVGYDVAGFNAGGDFNTYVGHRAGYGNFGLFPKASSFNNVYVGDSAGYFTNGGRNNAFVGKRAGFNNQTGNYNVLVGDSSGYNNSSGSGNTFVGSKARASLSNITNATAIGANAQADVSNVIVLGGVAGVNGAASNVNVGIGTNAPNRRLVIQDGASSGVNASSNSLLVLDKTGGPNYLSILNGNFESGLVFGQSGAPQPPFNAGIFFNYSSSPDGLQFRNSGGLTRMIIHGNGNISIGQNNNNYKLSVLDGSSSSGVTAFANSSLVLDKNGSSHFLSLLNGNFETGILFGIAGTASANVNGGIVYNSSVSPQGLQFRTGGNSAKMTISSDGKVGIGTTSPDYRLHVVTADAQNFGYREGIVVENIASGVGNTGEAAISFKNAGDAGTGTNQWIVGLNQNRNLAFAYGDNFAGGSLTKMLLDSTGNLGLGTTAPAFQLQLSQNSAAKPTSSSWTVASDARLKKNIRNFDDGLSVIKKINPIWFTYTGAAGLPQESGVGTTAQAMQAIAPYMVKPIGIKTGDMPDLLGVDYGPLQFIMVNAIKQQQQVIEKQTSEIDLLKKRLEMLERMVVKQR